ncbi:urea transporter [Microbulbifer variabilis]|uniref:Urea transporter n=1 Tax=Microbulbifer variabilis TaxID=266805 RepID=A0ABY4VGY5_9GAMM|nr:urea transporter [Microbulbifer variabilis]USD23591.1 urea transporter [Microbulbifer variabilis]
MKKSISTKVSCFLVSLLRGISQVILQKNALSGALFLFGVAVNSITMAIGVLVGVISSTIFAHIEHYPVNDIEEGLFGYNGALIGVVIFSLYAPSSITVFLIIAGSALTVLIMRLMMIHFPLPAYTAPYIMVIWVIWAMAPALNLEPAITSMSEKISTWGIFEGIGQIIFQNNAITGACFLLGIFISNKLHALWGIIGGLFATLLAELLSLSTTLILSGIFGYNASLCAIALTSRSKLWFAPLVGSALTVPIAMAFINAGIIVLTAPFVLSSWAILLLKKRFSLTY